MKVIGTDNFDRDNVSDFLHKAGLTDEEAKALADALNKKSGDDAPTYFKAVPDDYQLYKWEP